MMRVAMYLSKMTVTDEKRDGLVQFTHISEAEWPEFIGRLAYAYFENTTQHGEWLLHQKIEVLLNMIF